jgi:hypothetical protein
VITLSVADVRPFEPVNIHEGAGPDGLPGRVLRACGDQLACVFIDIFNLSLTELVMPTCFKQTTIVSVPKNTNTIIKFANDTIVVGLITENDETAYREEVRDLTS